MMRVAVMTYDEGGGDFIDGRCGGGGAAAAAAPLSPGLACRRRTTVRVAQTT